MSHLRPVRWREGMFLRPQHFQQHDATIESTQIVRQKSFESYPWGVVHLDLVEEALDNFTVEIRSLRVVLPDGTLLDVPGNARCPSRRIEPGSLDPSNPVVISVAVRDMEDRRPRIIDRGPGRGEARFLGVEEEVADLDVGSNPVLIERMEFDAQLLLNGEPDAGFVTLPIVSLVATGVPSRPLGAAPKFSPPALKLSASPAAHGAARAVVERLSTVLRKMDDVRGTEKIREIVLYQALAGHLPVLRDLAWHGDMHPRACYLELARLAGTLFFRETEGRSFDAIPLYDHLRPGPVFEALRALIEELSEPLFVARYRRIPLDRVEADDFRATLPPEAGREGYAWFLEVDAGDGGTPVPENLWNAKVSSGARVEFLRQNALPGVMVLPQSGAPAVLPPGSRGSYFRLRTEDGNEWAVHVVPGGQIVVDCRDVPAGVSMNLIVVLPETSEGR